MIDVMYEERLTSLMLVHLETSHPERSLSKHITLKNIPSIFVTLLTSQLDRSPTKELLERKRMQPPSVGRLPKR